jgi:predicted N-acetyltransferase YhbS
MQWVERDAAELFRGSGLIDVDTMAVAAISDHMRSIEEGFSFVAEEAGRVAGFVMGEMKEGGAYLHELDVVREAQGRGLGRQLIGRFNEEARYKRASCVFLSTFRDPPWNAPFYRKLGFVDMAGGDRLPWMTAMEAEQAKFLDLNTRVFMRMTLT